MKRLSEDAARAGLKKWQRKLALARTKIKRYKRAVKRYARISEADKDLRKAMLEAGIDDVEALEG